MGKSLFLINIGVSLIVPMVITHLTCHEIHLHYKSLEKIPKSLFWLRVFVILGIFATLGTNALVYDLKYFHAKPVLNLIFFFSFLLPILIKSSRKYILENLFFKNKEFSGVIDGTAFVY